MTIGNVYLTGFMGAGKSSIAPLLARMMALKCIDLDQAVVTKYKRSICEWFAIEGEAAFRQAEQQCLLQYSCGFVVALGGGAFINPMVRHHIACTGLSVYVDWPLDVLIDRIFADHDRPLVTTRSEISDMYRKRDKIYRCADVVWKSQPPHLLSARATARSINAMLRHHYLFSSGKGKP